MERKKRIFLGSAIESKSIAEQIGVALSEKYEVVLWYEDFFSLGEHFYDELITKIITFDFAIMIGGIDDFVLRMPEKKSTKFSPRDNVYLEYGLFSGFLSANRVLFLLHKECTVASDLSGMSLALYGSDEEAISFAKSWIDKYPERYRNKPKSNIELLPSYGIAVGYYVNFVERFVKLLYSAKKEELPYEKVRLNICIPDYIISDSREYQSMFYQSKNLEYTTMFTHHIHIDKNASQDVLQLYDVPNTMLALFKTVDTIFGITDPQDTDDSICAKQRALESFKDALTNLISRNPYVSLNSDEKRVSVYVTQFSDPTV